MTPPMDTETRHQLRGIFDSAADNYATARPSYPPEVVAWMLSGTRGAAAFEAPRPGLDVLDLGAGAGALTRLLRDFSHRLVAAEPSGNLLRELRTVASTDGVAQASAEALPFADGSFDVVTVATAFHWFDPATALPEIARVLRPGGAVSLVWNLRALTTSFARDMESLLRRAQPAALSGAWGSDSASALDDDDWFAPPARAEFDHSQLLDRTMFVDLVGSRSYVIAKPSADRQAILTEAADLFDAHAGEHGQIVLPYIARCWRSVRR
jgi:ubiquinone/menaquinone biosynthesis C-methylase UbiE